MQRALLERCLHNSYEHNKAEAFNLMVKLQIRSRKQPTEIMELLLSARQPVSEAAVYQLQVYCQSTEVEFSLPVGQLHAFMSPCTFACSTQQAQVDLRVAAKKNP